jgi:methylmalonyl-CoA/ethylmalonyl-CoA epimerase
MTDLVEVAQHADDLDRAAAFYARLLEAEPHVIFTHGDDSLGPAGMAEWQAFVRGSEGNLVGLVSFHEPD